MKDAIVILGGLVHKDGSLSDMAQSRVEQGVELFKQGVAPRLVLSGYKFYWSNYKSPKTEAQAMKDYATSMGVPEDIIHLEESARNTLGNAYYIKKDVLEPNGWNNIAVVTSDFHVPRSQYIFEKILGSGYEIEMFGAEGNIQPSKLEMLVNIEKNSFAFWKIILGLMPAGCDSYTALVIKVSDWLRS